MKSVTRDYNHSTREIQMSHERDTLSEADMSAIGEALRTGEKVATGPHAGATVMVPVFTAEVEPSDIDKESLVAGMKPGQARIVGRTQTMQTFVDPAQLKDDIDIDPNSIPTEMLRQPALHAYYAVLSSKADFQESVFKLRFEVIEAQLAKRVRVALNSRPGVKVTESMVAETVKTQTAYQDAFMELAEAESIATISRSAMRSIEQRRDMLVQINKDQLQEKGSRFGAGVTAERGDLRSARDRVLKKIAALGAETDA